MASSTPQGAKLLNGLQRARKFDVGTAALLPQAYLKFYRELKAQPTSVHYIPKEGSWERDEVTGIVKPIQNVPIPLIFPPEHHLGIWGGEGVIKGFQKRNPNKKRVPHYWIPILRRSVVHSVVLNKYWSTIVTLRTIELIHESHGFDHYLLKTPACDLKSKLALKIKRHILQALLAKCPDVDPKKRDGVLEEYSQYLDNYTPEEIEWYGYLFDDAVRKMNIQLSKEREHIVPQKIEFRSKLIQQLKEAGIAEAQESISEGTSQSQIGETSSWLSKMNPFGKKQET